MRVALIHDWLNGMRGGEKVLEALCELFPNAVIFTLFYQPEKVSERIRRHEVRVSFLDKIPGSAAFYRNFLPLFPRAIGSFDFKDFDLCISISHSVAKGIQPGLESLHICLCLTPMRYIWDRFDDYFANSSLLKRRLISRIFTNLRRWDVESSSRVDLFISISKFVKWRIEKFYQRSSAVIYPFADTDFFKPETGSGAIGKSPLGDFYLAVSALVPYKRIDDIVAAFRGRDERVVIVGDGPDKKRLVRAASRNIEFTGWVSDEHLRSLYQNCRALIFPGVEDFGIVPVEVQACGKPVLALAEGGALETVIGPTLGVDAINGSGATGLFFKKAGPDGIIEAVKKSQSMKFDSQIIRENALRFSKSFFQRSILDFITESFSHFRSSGRSGLETHMMSRRQYGGRPTE